MEITVRVSPQAVELPEVQAVVVEITSTQLPHGQAHREMVELELYLGM
jgi:hypothetical protein